jgi:hypothetical protein
METNIYKRLGWALDRIVPPSGRPYEYELITMATSEVSDPEKKVINTNDDDDVLVQLGYTQGNVIRHVRSAQADILQSSSVASACWAWLASPSALSHHGPLCQVFL